MTAPTILTDTAGYVLYEAGPRLVFVRRGTSWTFWARFVLGLVTFILAVNGLFQIYFGIVGNRVFLFLGVGLTTFAAIGGAALFAIQRFVARRAARPITDYPPIVVLDREAGALLDPSGRPLANLADVRFVKTFQFTSSAPGLRCRWPGGAVIVSRGGAMGLSGVDDVVEALRARGLTMGGREIAL